MAMIFFRFWRKLVKMKFVSWKLQNWFFLHMQLKTTSLLKGLPREMFEVPERTTGKPSPTPA